MSLDLSGANGGVAFWPMTYLYILLGGHLPAREPLERSVAFRDARVLGFALARA